MFGPYLKASALPKVFNFLLSLLHKFCFDIECTALRLTIGSWASVRMSSYETE